VQPLGQRARNRTNFRKAAAFFRTERLRSWPAEVNVVFLKAKLGGAIVKKKAYEKPVLVKRASLSTVIASGDSPIPAG
jgi:hypothetical protein